MDDDILARVRAALDGRATVGKLDIDSLRQPQASSYGFRKGGQTEAIDVTEDFLAAMAAMEAGAPVVFVTGRAGTGKSTFIRLVQSLSACPHVTVAPTGIAALSCRGQTIHSLFHLPARMMDPSEIRRTPRDPALFRHLQRLIIDEAGMMRADVLDIVDLSLKKWRRSRAPFGGVQVVLVGDLLQLPPVVTAEEAPILEQKYRSPWFFSAEALQNVEVVTVELRQVFRQRDEAFVELLSRIRLNRDHKEAVATLNRQCYRDAERAGKSYDLTLTATNRQADAINKAALERLPGEPRTYHAVIQGNFSVKGGRMPAPEELVLKEGAQVMVVKNTNGCVNGTIANVISMTPSTVTIRRRNASEAEDDITLGQEAWDDHKFSWNAADKKIESEVSGRYLQIPLVLASAVTVHKSQGLTLDSVKIDLGSGAFAEGQTYVALSRVRSLDGLVLARPLSMRDVRADDAVVEFYERLSRGLE